MPAIICPHCGVTNRAYSNFCNNCGADLRTLPIDAAKRAIDPPANLAGDSATEPITERSTDVPAPRLRQDRTLPDASELATDDDAPIDDEQTTGEQAYSDSPIASRPELSATRLVPGIQGVLDPHSIALWLSNEPSDSSADGSNALLLQAGMATEPKPSLQPGLSAERIEDLQATMSMDPQLENSLVLLGNNVDRETLRMPLLFALLLVTLMIVLGLKVRFPMGDVEPLPGVFDAYAFIDGLAPRANILTLWAYDPATAGEMDLVVKPVMDHLFEKEGQLAVVSTLPTGPATARRLWNEVATNYSDANRTALIDLGYLPGGSAAMPLLAYTDVLSLLRYGIREYGAGASFVQFWQQKPDLMLIVASQAEDVQYWLEQVQPLNGIPTIAVTSAGADPALRPYWNSHQLGGLITGFDGGTAYELLRQSAQQGVLTPESRLRLAETGIGNSHLVAQNWGHLILLGLLLLGNLSILLGR